MILSGLRGVGKPVLLNVFAEQARRNDWLVIQLEAQPGLARTRPGRSLHASSGKLDIDIEEFVEDVALAMKKDAPRPCPMPPAGFPRRMVIPPASPGGKVHLEGSFLALGGTSPPDVEDRCRKFCR